MSHVYGLAIRLVGDDGSPPRTSASFFGRGPFASGPGDKLQENPPELQCLGIAGLEEGHGTRDRWQYLAVSDVAVSELGPIDFFVEVPGYRALSEKLHLPRLEGELAEISLALQPVAEQWGRLAVRLVAAPHVLKFDLVDEERVGGVDLLGPGDEEIGFAIHARALRETESIGEVPVGAYGCFFEAEDSGYQTEATEIDISPGDNLLEFDLSEAGSLLVDVIAGGVPYDGRWVMRIDFPDGGLFYSTFNAGPYLVPFMDPGRYRVTEANAPDRSCPLVPDRVFEIFEGELTVELLSCFATR